MNLKDKIVVITGGSEGLGKELAKLLVMENAQVIISARNKEKLEVAAKEVGATGMVADVTKEEDLENLGRVAIERFGRIDVWINNAGLWLSHQYAEDFDMDEVRQMFNVNVFGLMNGSRVALRYMKKKQTGIILNIASSSALVGRPKGSMYAASKWAVNGFLKSIREENKDSSISVLAVFPAAFKTNIFKDKKPMNFDTYMDVGYVAMEIIENLKRESPEIDLNISQS